MIRQITVGNLCGEFAEMLHKLQYSSDSLRRYNKVFEEFTAYAGERMYAQSLGLNSSPGNSTKSEDSLQKGYTQKMRCITSV